MSAELKECDCGETPSIKSHANGDGTRMWFVVCEECETRTNDFVDANEAVENWEMEDEYEEDGGNEEEDAETIATLVRMLDEERNAHEKLKASYQTRKMQNLMMAYGGQPKGNEEHILEQLKLHEQLADGAVVDVRLVASDVVPKMQARINELSREMKQKERKIEEISVDHARSLSDLKNALQRSHVAETTTRGHKKVLAYIDVELTKLRKNLVKGLGIFKEAPHDLASIDHVTRSMRNGIEPRVSDGKEEIMYSIIDLVSPYGSHSNLPIYEAAVSSLSGDDSEKDSVFGKVISIFGQRTQPYNIAYDALGRPGETIHTARPPRT